MKKSKKIIFLLVSIIIITFSIFIPNNSYSSTSKSTIYINSITNNYGESIVTSQYSNNSDIKEVIIESGITEIHDEAFGNCTNLADITIPRTVEYISAYAFWNCPNTITIHGYEGTVAEEYAKKYGYNFQKIENQANLLPTYIENEVAQTKAKVNSLNKTGAISFSFITDIHADSGTYSSMANINAFTNIGNSGLLKFGICAGDITNGGYEDLKSGKGLYNLEYYSNLLKDMQSPTLFARGNHDCNTRTDSSVAISGVQYYESILQQLQGVVTFNKDDLGGDYYYKDLEKEKIRVCVLNAFNGENYEFIFGDKQLEFVANKVLDLSEKDNAEEWQVLFLTHTIDKSEAHEESPSDNETLYNIINAFQEGKKDNIGNISVDYTNQGKGTVIAIITGHHHLDTTTVKNNILIITVRSASIIMDRANVNKEQYSSDDISFDIFSIDKESKTLYATKVGRGNDRQWSYDINNLKENTTEEDSYNISYTTDDYIDVGTMVNHNNEVIAIVTSNVELQEKSNKTWKLSKDRKTYIKVLNDVADTYTTTFTNLNGYSKTYTFNLNEIKDVTPPKLELSYINNDDGTISAKVISNEILQMKSNQDWKLSENRKEYIYIFTKNTENYTTAFKDMFDNETKLTLKAKVFEPVIEYIQNEDGTITAKTTSNIQFANTKPTWTLSGDGHTYTKRYETNQNYSTNFTDIYGNVVTKGININSFNEDIDVEISYRDNGDGTITAIAVSKNNKFTDTKPTWILSADGYTYTKIYDTTQNYSTTFTNVYGKSINLNIKF